MKSKARKIINVITLFLSSGAFILAAAAYVPEFGLAETAYRVLREELAREAFFPETPVLSEDETEKETIVREEETSPVESEEAPPETSSETESAEPDPPAEETGIPVIERDMSANQTPDSLSVINMSGYDVDLNEYARADYPVPYAVPASPGSSEPLVLIIHTHGTESYLPENTNRYSDPPPSRSKDITENVVEVGRILAETLIENGIPAIHCETMFDLSSYSAAYDESEKATLRFLKDHPSIRYVFDVHRDSIVSSDGTLCKCVCTNNGVCCAQAMFVVGTDSGGAKHPNWRENLKVAAAFQYALVKKYPSLMRPVNLRAPSFNAEHATGAVLIEIGSSGNSLDEAKNTARALGEVISGVIKGEKKE